MYKEKHEEEKSVSGAEDPLEAEARGYKALKTSRWRSVGTPEDPNAPAYIVSKKWMKQWKKYVGIAEKQRYMTYPYYSSQQPKESAKGKERPGPITNSDILEDPSTYYTSDDPEDIYNVILKPEQRERLDYKILNDKQWEYLYSKYSGTPIKREKFKPEYYAYLQVEVYFQKINLVVMPPRDEFDVEKITPPKPLYASKRWTLAPLRERIVKVLNSPKYGYRLNVSKFRLWKLDPTVALEDFLGKLRVYTEKIRSTPITNADGENIEENTGIEFPGICLDLFSNKTLEKCNIGDTEKVFLEQANDKGEFIFKYLKTAKIGRCEFCYQDRPLVVACKCKEVFYCSEACKKKDERFHAEKCSAIDTAEDLSVYKQKANSNMGLTGLQNLGNTCFMNSGIQCMSNTWELTRYFLEDKYSGEINTTNKLGTQGRLAMSYAKLMKLLWYDDSQFASPWDLKKTVGNYHRAFSGFAQQDAQELISTVLDGLHEDLNRVKTKPYIESKSTDDPNDDTISIESWYHHLARNQSIIVDLMHGQFKSIVQCTSCGRYSVTFDPFSVVSLPLPQENMVPITFYFVPYNVGEPIIKCALTAEKDESVKNFREKISSLLGIHKDSMVLTTISANTFDRFICRDRKVKLIYKLATKRNSILYVFQINPTFFNGPENFGIESKEADEKLRKELKEKQEKESLNTNDVAMGKNVEEEKYGPERPQNQNWGYPGNYYYSSKKKKVEDIEDHDDYNNGLVDDVLKVYFHFYQESKYSYIGGVNKERKSFNRVIHIKRSWTLKQLHLEVFKYLRPLFERELQKKEDDVMSDTTDLSEDAKQALSSKKVSSLSDTELFEKLFPDLTEENWESKLQAGSGYPYILRLVNISGRNTWSRENCLYCSKSDCTNCPVPFSDILRVSDLLSKINEKALVKNDYYFKEHPYYNADKKEFELEVVFAGEKQQAIANLDDLDRTEVHPKYSEILSGKDKAVSIHDCFDLFTKWETLDENNLWYCNKCKNSVQAKKKMEVFKCPPILILHLKRFRMRESGMMSTAGRINVLVDFPLEGLDLSKHIKYSGAEPIYDLYAVSNHYGNTGFGHYTAFAYNHHAEGWYRFDDSSVTKADKSEVCSVASYVLFYKRRDLHKGVDYEKLKQTLPVDYSPPVIEIKPKVEPMKVAPQTTSLVKTAGQGQRGGAQSNQPANEAEEMKDIDPMTSLALPVVSNNNQRQNRNNQNQQQNNQNINQADNYNDQS